MISRHGIKARRGLLLSAALCALALLAIPSLATAKDRNNDRLPDKWEKSHKLSLKVNQAKRDQDRDHLSNRGEFKSGMDPRDRDSDDDGVNDSDENAGTISSFDAETGKLVISLYGGDTVSGFVTADTEIKCGCSRGDDQGQATVSHDGSDNSGPGRGGDDDPADHDENDDHGEGADDGPNHDVGDDHGQGDDDGPNHDVGDDHGHHAGDDHANCTTDALVVGTVVDEAELKLGDGKAVFREVELERSQAQPTS
jgi:hypothetical protein